MTDQCWCFDAGPEYAYPDELSCPSDRTAMGMRAGKEIGAQSGKKAFAWHTF